MREELLLDRVSVEECRSWLCRRARGTGGGILFCLEFDRLSGSSGLPVDGDIFSGAALAGGGDNTGVGGSGLLVSETFRGLITGDGAASFGAKLSKDTVWG